METRFKAVLNTGKSFPKSYSSVNRLIKAIKETGLKVTDISKIEQFQFNEFKSRGRESRKY